MTTLQTRSTAPTGDQLDAEHPAARRAGPRGPAANLVALPDSAGLSLTAPAEVDAHLCQIETARQRQLDEMTSTTLDPVAAAYWGTVERILGEVRAARRRVAAGLYGVCTRCELKISAERLELRPWAGMCARCAERNPA